jgi:uncharacterized membrane protein YkvA (DUF1232 family)
MSLVWIVVIACLAVVVLLALASLLLLWRRREALRDSEMSRLVGRAAALPFRSQLRLAGGLLTDRRVPLRARVILPALVLYLAMPLDLVPDFIPVLGYLDDLLIVLAAAWLFLRLVPTGVLEAHVAALEGEEGLSTDGRTD